jgi:hypothetical protein
MLEEAAGWIAPIATMIAAMMTAANLGARVTGWGFVVFTIGSVGWSIVGASSGQTNLVATNGFLTLVNAVGIWRWLGRQRAYEDGAQAAAQASRRSYDPTLFPATGLAGITVVDATGEKIGQTVEGLIACDSGTLSYVVVASGGIGGIDETLRAVARDDLRFGCEQIELLVDRSSFERLAPLEAGAWPASAPPAARQACTARR